jgi:hypothetical protein
LTPGGSSIHLHTNSTQNTEDGTHITITREKNNYKEKIGKFPRLVAMVSFSLSPDECYGRVLREFPDESIRIFSNSFKTIPDP